MMMEGAPTQWDWHACEKGKLGTGRTSEKMKTEMPRTAGKPPDAGWRPGAGAPARPQKEPAPAQPELRQISSLKLELQAAPVWSTLSWHPQGNEDRNADPRVWVQNPGQRGHSSLSCLCTPVEWVFLKTYKEKKLCTKHTQC